MKSILKDRLGRPLRDLRISVTDRCNFRCRYCMPPEIFDKDYQFLPKKEILSFEEITYLSRLFVKIAGVKKLRITGGEPLMRKDLPLLMKQLNEIDGIDDIAMTTNGSLLPRYAAELNEAGLHRVTISLDSLNDEKFRYINGRDIGVSQVLAGIDAALEHGMQVKVNMVVKRGMNDDDIIPMARHFKETKAILRFIEYMDVGNTNGWKLDHVISKKEIFNMIHAEMPLEPVDPNYTGEVADRFKYKGSDHEIGIISSVTDAFCSTCSRARLSADGKLVTCLFASDGHDLRHILRSGATEEQLVSYIQSIWEKRDDRYSEERLKHTESQEFKKIEMSHIGG